jgi:hypothetical protein
MRTAVVLIIVTLLAATPALAQTTQDQPRSHKAIKIMVGVGALAIGAWVAAKSSETTTGTSAIGIPFETSTFSKSQLITGLVIAGAGGIVLWDGLRDHGPSSPNTVLGVAISKNAGSRVFVRRSW